MALNLEALMASARVRAGGLTDFGEDGFRAAAQALIGALNTEGGLSEMGEALLRARITELLKNRLIMEDCYRRYPEIDQERIGGPIVIVGLPRTGTTLLHRVLGCDRRFHALNFWESCFPSPNVPPDSPGEDPRIEQGKALVRQMLEANPTLLAIHPFNATEPDEEGMLLEHSFQSFFDAYVDIPSYTAWMWEHDQVPAYAHLKRMFKFLQWQKRLRGVTAEDWVLKAPHHLRQIDALFNVFPGTRVVLTHRDPLQTIPSIASFHENLWKIHMTAPNPARAGRQWSDIWARGMKETMAFRDRQPPERFCDVCFHDTLAKPLEVVKTIYDWLGISFPADTKDKMQAYLEANSREKRPLHQYGPDRYGLSEEQIKRDFAAYRARHVAPHLA